VALSDGGGADSPGLAHVAHWALGGFCVSLITVVTSPRFCIGRDCVPCHSWPFPAPQ
jgi:PP-loop superfamily ATP-utilizing enzyme